jgi:hypothetical protein
MRGLSNGHRPLTSNMEPHRNHAAWLLAEGIGFEHFYMSPVFKTGPINHSGIPPVTGGGLNHTTLHGQHFVLGTSAKPRPDLNRRPPPSIESLIEGIPDVNPMFAKYLPLQNLLPAITLETRKETTSE